MALVEGCKHALEISVPAAEVESETARVVVNIQKRAHLKGFRPGKAPLSHIRSHFADDIRQQVLENLVPKYLQQQVEAENLNLVGRPDISDVHFHDGEPLRFKAEFEVIPEIQLQEYKGVEVPYHDPEVTDQDVDTRLAELREQKADYVNVDPRPIEKGDHAVVSLLSLSGVDGEPVKSDEMVLEIGGSDTFDAFTENLQGASPGDEKEFDVTYPEDYGSPRLAGKTIRFHAKVKGIRRKELPELDDAFAKDLGDYLNLDELRDAVRKALFAQREREAQAAAKNAIVDKLVASHEFAVPGVLVDRQIQNRVEQSVRALASEGVDPTKLNLDWEKIRESQREKAVHEVKASLILSRVASVESIGVTREEVDREVERIARQQREMVAAVQKRFEKDGTLNRIASHIQSEKTLNFLFEHARKTA